MLAGSMLVLLASGTLAGCGGGSSGPVSVSAPRSVSPVVGAYCGRLHDSLPARLDGRATTVVRPSSSLVAAWGDPPVVLRCGVPKPARLRKTSQVIEVGGGTDAVSWFLRETDDEYVFTTVGRAAYVEVRVPSSVAREEATAPLVDLARPVIEAVPTTEDAHQGP